MSSHVQKITKDEVKAAMKRMKHGKAVGSDDIPIEAWKALGDRSEFPDQVVQPNIGN